MPVSMIAIIFLYSQFAVQLIVFNELVQLMINQDLENLKPLQMRESFLRCCWINKMIVTYLGEKSVTCEVSQGSVLKLIKVHHYHTYIINLVQQVGEVDFGRRVAFWDAMIRQYDINNSFFSGLAPLVNLL